jgi:glycosyltransferase involved in cell wall biosynthesis
MNSTVLPSEIIIAASEINNVDYLYNDFENICSNVKLIIFGTVDKCYSGINRNRGFTKCSNDIIIFIDADDIIHPQKIEIVQKCFKLFPDCKQILHQYDISEKILKLVFNTDELPIFKYQGNFTKTDTENKMKNITRGHVTIHRSVFNKIIYGNLIQGQDSVFTKKVHNIFNESYFLPLRLIIYNKTGGIELKKDHYFNNKY